MQLVLAHPAAVVDVDAGDSVSHLLAAVEARIGIPRQLYTVRHNGRILAEADWRTVAAAGLQGGDTLRIAPRLLGGGGDGGVYPPTATELGWMNDIGGGTKRQAWAVLGGSVRRTQFEKIADSVKRLDACTTCAISGEPLRAPVVCCELGMLYNKESVLEALLNKGTRPLDERFSHLRSLKDLVTVTLHTNPEYSAAAAAAGGADTSTRGLDAPFCCPVTKLPFNGRHPFFAVRTSGHVVSERALTMLDFKTCPVTDAALAPPDVTTDGAGSSGRGPASPDLIRLALPDDEMEQVRSRLAEARAARKKSGKKRARGEDPAADGSSGKAPSGPAAAPDARVPSSKAAGKQPAVAPPAAAAPRVSSLAASRLAALAHAEVSRKHGQSEVLQQLFVTKEAREEAARAVKSGKDFMTRSITVKQDRAGSG